MIIAPFKGLLITACIASAVFAPVNAVRGNPLDGKSCEELGVEQDALKALGVEGDMAKGHEWARANLAQNDLNMLRRFIEISERVKFRCAGVTKTKVEVKLSVPGQAVQAGALSPPPPLPQKRNIQAQRPKPATASAFPGLTKPPSATAPSTRIKTQPQKPPTPQKAGES
ncbi:MAG: hypothetical protein H7X92_06585 [Chitinophagales bacterium]|nr:hypothetical protein [Hyphomicrobiales bacterium]